jgi:hypothetical protein
MNLVNVTACNTMDEKMEKDKIYKVLKQLDAFYQSDGYIINKSAFPPFEWTISTSAVVKNYGKIDLSDSNIKSMVTQKLKALENLNLCTAKYTGILNTRNNKALSLGMLLISHAYSDNILGLMAQKASFDYYPPNSNPDGPTDPILLKNDKLTETQIEEWHKRHISLTDTNQATYKVMYTEVGLPVTERANAFFTISLVKEDGIWKIDDISIKEISETDMMTFWKKNLEIRK